MASLDSQQTLINAALPANIKVFDADTKNCSYIGGLLTNSHFGRLNVCEPTAVSI